MNKDVLFSYSPWYILLCILIGVLYAVFLYPKNDTFTKSQDAILRLLRGFGVSLICFLLLNPLFKFFSYYSVKPEVTIIVDNSESMKAEASQVLKDLKLFQQKLKYEIKVIDLDQNQVDPNTLIFNRIATNFSDVFSNLKGQKESSNIKSAIVLSDGLVNQGYTDISDLGFNLYSVGYGDTTSKKDIKIGRINYNTTVLANNETEIKVNFSAKKLSGKQTNISIFDGENLVVSRPVIINSSDFYSSQSFNIPSGKEIRTMSIRIRINPLEEEINKFNNEKKLAIKVIEEKEKIEIIAASPHPDIKAIKSILEKEQQYEVNVINAADKPSENSSIYIFHNLPSKTVQLNPASIEILKTEKPKVFFIGQRTNFEQFNTFQKVFEFKQKSLNNDEITGSVNPSFSLFSMPEKVSKISEFGTIDVPYGDLTIKPGSEIILYQNIGSLKTDKPLMAINQESKELVVFSNMLWRWRLKEFDLTNEQSIFDSLLPKSLKLIANKEDKSKLRVIPTKELFSEEEPLEFQIWTLNDLLEPIYNQKVKFTINGKSYDFSPQENSNTLRLPSLSSGIYPYQATSNISGKEYKVVGEVQVQNFNLELQETQANWNFLKNISLGNEGIFASKGNISQIIETINNKNYPEKLISIEDFQSLISFKYLFFILVLIFGIEWFLRKYFGTY